jgi:hypothetical protein
MTRRRSPRSQQLERLAVPPLGHGLGRGQVRGRLGLSEVGGSTDGLGFVGYVRGVHGDGIVG